jgi:hypothetical protein
MAVSCYCTWGPTGKTKCFRSSTISSALRHRGYRGYGFVRIDAMLQNAAAALLPVLPASATK